MPQTSRLGLVVAIFVVALSVFFIRLTHLPPVTAKPDEVKLAALRAELLIPTLRAQRLLPALPEQGGRAAVLVPVAPGASEATPAAQSFMRTLEKASWQLERIKVQGYSDESGSTRYDITSAQLKEALSSLPDITCVISLVGGAFLYEADARFPPAIKFVIADNPDSSGLENRRLFQSGKAHVTFVLREEASPTESTGDKLTDWFNMNYELVGSLR